MKSKIPVKLHLAAFAFLVIPMLVHSCGCRSMAADSIDGANLPQAADGIVAPEREKSEPHSPATENVARADQPEVRPVEEKLGATASETYAYLRYMQALLDEDEAELLDSADLLKETDVPSNAWLDGGVWLMGRKSPNSVIYLEQALKAHPDDLSLNLLYAEALGDHGMASRGIDAMRSYLEKHPGADDARIEMALLMVKDKQFSEALKILSKTNPKQRKGLVAYYQGKALMGMDRPAEAIPYLRKAVQDMPDLVDALLDLAYIYETEGNLREARTAYERLRKMNFSPEQVTLRLVELSLKLKQPEKALQYIKQGPDSLAFKLNAANLFRDARHYLQAENILKQIVAGPNAPVEAYLMLAEMVYEQRRNLTQAFSWLDKIPADSPGAEKAALLRIQLLAEAGKSADALKTVDEYLKKYPDAPEFTDIKVRILARDKKFTEALPLAREIAAKYPDNTAYSFLLGSILDETGNKKEALDVMENILKKQPDNFQALNYVGFTLADENRDLPRALELLKAADALSPNQAYIVDSLAWALFRAGKGKEALAQIRRAISLGGMPDATIWEHYGDIAREQGKKDEARRAYRKAIELKPSNVEDIRVRLSRL